MTIVNYIAYIAAVTLDRYMYIYIYYIEYVMHVYRTNIHRNKTNKNK